MTTLKSSVLSKAAAIGVLVAGISLLLGITAYPLWSMNASYQDRIDELSYQLAHAQAIKKQDSELRRRYADVRRIQRSQGFVLESRSEALAAAELQRILKDVAGRQELSLVSTQILPAASEKELTRVSIRAKLKGPFENIVRTVYDLETNGVFLFLDNFTVRQTVGQRVRTVRVVPHFETGFDLSAYLLEAT
ncbi:MAG: type II secretion system protein GspM [Gammaproteobacteria bacterium]|nr:type II secretion system protein GspM [Gammaproteobacteria bacterium]